MAQGKQKWHIGSFTVRTEPNDDGGFRLIAEGPSGDARFLEIKDASGHIELRCPGSNPTGTGLELDEGGHAVFHLE